MERQEHEAAAIINGGIEMYGASEESLNYLERRQEMVDAGVRDHLRKYVTAFRGVYRDMTVRKFDGNTAGLYDGSNIYIDEAVPEVAVSVQETIDRGTEVHDHELYHKKNNHTAPMKIVKDQRRAAFLVMGGVEFKQSTQFFEGITVDRTGDRFVHGTYRAHKSQFNDAIGRAGLSLEDVEQAIDGRDLTQIDDRTSDQAFAA